VCVRESDGVRYWKRPGKEGPGWSATTGYCHGADGAELLRVFSSNASPFEEGKAYGKFRAYALLHHGGDYQAAARELASKGYGASCPHHPPPQGQKRWGQLLTPVPASQLHTLCATEHIDWTVQGIVARAMNTLFAGRAKDAGKTTFWSYLMPLWEEGGWFCHLEVKPAKVLWISEEAPMHWEARRKRLRIGDWVRFHCLPFKRGKPSGRDWGRYLDEVAAYCEDEKITVVGWDTITHLSPVRNENDNAEVAAALMPLAQLQDIGVANLLLHHFGWGAERSRGASEYEAFVDFIFNYQDLGKQHPRRRLLDGKGRCEPLPFQLTVELAEDKSGFSAVDSPAEVSAWEKVDAILPMSEPGWSAEEIHARLPAGTRLAEHTIKNKIKAEASMRGWARTGGGKSGDPYRYYKPNRN
jgi:hypothetical protein